MEKLKILDDCEVIVDNNFDELNIIEPASIIYFCDVFSEEDALKFEKNTDLTVLCKSNNTRNSKISIIKNPRKIKKLNENIFIILNINDDYDYLKFAIRNMQKVVNMCKTSGKEIKKVEIINHDSKYYNDVIDCIKAMFIFDNYKRYEFIYDTMCDVIDKKFSECDYCKFENDACNGNRNKNANHKTMGCCYSFEYCGFFSLKGIKNVKQCALLKNGHCSTKNLSCKLFTCKEIREKISFNIHDYLLLECLFSRKQRDVISSAFFVTREDILEKLIEAEKNKDCYFVYFLLGKYGIDKRY